MFKAIFQAIAAFLTIKEWRERNVALKLTFSISKELYEAKCHLFQLEAAADTSFNLDLARLRVVELETQLQSIERTRPSTPHNAPDLQAAAGATNPK